MFYNRLFEIDPSLRPLFKGNMKEQGRKLMQMIGVAVWALDKLETVIVGIEELGVRHLDYGVKDEHYDTVGAALLWTLEQQLGEEYTPEVAEAWTETYILLADVMKKAAAEQEITPAKIL